VVEARGVSTAPAFAPEPEPDAQAFPLGSHLKAVARVRLG